VCGSEPTTGPECPPGPPGPPGPPMDIGIGGREVMIPTTAVQLFVRY